MNKKELARKIARDNEITIALAEQVVDSVFDNVKNALKDSDEVSIHGFGKFNLKHTPTRAGRNPRTGETVQVAAKTAIKFKMSKGAV